MASIARLPDVYVVTLQTLIEWMRAPVPLQSMGSFEPLNCRRKMSAYPSEAIPTCAKPNKCVYPTPFLNSPEHQFLTCNPCPAVFPWVNNPLGALENGVDQGSTG